MKLQSDPTVICTGKNFDGDLEEDLNFDSPYNTCRYKDCLLRQSLSEES